ncbi:hypothetical protein BGZ61DRAFT_223239 [Ilyonectria robusta]|uniref:uncharacterized protein n=1 Tax=Ilyonectria robusta TaxID=1079257 RepID=UPI001E8D8780|nr:uncharacterized protein BGZ61DRAFT_223239 [Ilyonectria robusta]KAH8706550.1 hypothetical protein BGZ61DRAFT_223239 [Ilyonectria robusta]
MKSNKLDLQIPPECPTGVQTSPRTPPTLNAISANVCTDCTKSYEARLESVQAPSSRLQQLQGNRGCPRCLDCAPPLAQCPLGSSQAERFGRPKRDSSAASSALGRPHFASSLGFQPNLGFLSLGIAQDRGRSTLHSLSMSVPVTYTQLRSTLSTALNRDQHR